MNETKILRTASGETIAKYLPADPRIVFHNFCIGSDIQTHTYTEGVYTTGSGGVSGGGTRVVKYETVDFGFAVENTAAVSAIVRFTISQVGADGFSTKKWNVDVELAPGEKRRKWAGFQVKEESITDFRAYEITAIDIGFRASSEKGGQFEWGVGTKPKVTIYDACGFDELIATGATRTHQQRMKMIFWGGIATIFCSAFTGIPVIIMANRNRPLDTKAKIGYAIALFFTLITTIFWGLKLAFGR